MHFLLYLCSRFHAALAELVDALDLGSSFERSEGSSPLCRTSGRKTRFLYHLFFNSMKKSFLLLFVVFATFMTSCSGWLTGKSDHSPEIYSSLFFVNPVFNGDSLIGAQDTIAVVNDPTDDSYELTDTIYIGDTVVFANTYYAYENDLVAVQISWDSLRMNLWYNLSEDIQKVLTSSSDVERGRLYFQPGYNRVSFPIYFTPIQKGGMTIKLAVESTSEAYPINSALIYIPVKEHVADSIQAN